MNQGTIRTIIILAIAMVLWPTGTKVVLAIALSLLSESLKMAATFLDQIIESLL